MLKENWRFISRLERIVDGLLIVFAFFLAYYGRTALGFWDFVFDLGLPFEGPDLAPLKDYFIVLVIGLIAYAIALNALGAYSSMRLRSPWQLFRIALMSSLVVFFVLAASLFLLKINLSRSFIGLFCLLVAFGLAFSRMFVLRFLRFWRRRGVNYRNIIICGLGIQARRLAREIAQRPELGVRIRAFASLSQFHSSNEEVEDFRRMIRKHAKLKIVRVIVGLEGLERALRKYSIDEVIFTDVIDCMPQVEAAVHQCSDQGIETTIAADLFSIGLIKSGISYFGGMPLIHFQTPPGDRWELSLKRIFDILISGLLLLILSPLFLIIALAILFSMSAPIIFKQRRMGLNGRIFELYKFRSMRIGAEAEQTELAAQNEMNGPVFKIKDDPRVTNLGRFLRRFSLDELPQLWNVFKGEMSLVGPRPPLPEEVSLYERSDRRRLSMRPGMTCTWQVNGRNDIQNFEEWVRMDLDYIDNWSLWSDFIILFKTIPAVLLGKGAS
ncbi:MAG: sugar transferase [SAR324 cluster bacterium]|uniref:Sugar transferase n=1 Tax=SAR324 cluster bacterium TaxID=2024889 RepID=A0A7X9IKG1_9DELT|nr:sugar transferase [SAR324 cluster bacterium]